MAKRVVFAVAGSGKTSMIIDSLKSSGRSLIITYTVSNSRSIEQRILNEFGYIPDHIKVFTLFTFLYSFCYKPLLHKKLNAVGLCYKPAPQKVRGLNRYMNSHRQLYSNRVSDLLIKTEAMEDVIRRVSKYFDSIFIDEVQDFAGHDFNFLGYLVQAEVNAMLVGDYFQHTFDTSRDGQVNKNLHQDFASYKKRFEEKGLEVDEETLSRSYRCSTETCSFISQNLGIQISSHHDAETTVQHIDDPRLAGDLFHNSEIVKLFYQTHYRYPCRSRNWGECKGEDKYLDVCVVLNKTTMKKFEEGKLHTLVSSTKNKLYVALSRARGNVYLVSEELYKKYKE